MGSNAIGLIEVVGLLAAVEATDVCLKSANVKLLGCEDASGAMFTVKVSGDVGAVNAAISAAAASAARVGKVVSTLVLPRPATGIYPLLEIDEQPNIAQPKPQKPLAEETNAELAVQLELTEEAAPEPISQPKPEPPKTSVTKPGRKKKT